MNEKEIAEEIFNVAVDAVRPSALIPGCLSLNGNILQAGDFSIGLRNIDNIYVIGAGKASAAMAAEVEKILGDRITSGHVIVKYGHSVPLRRINITEAGHPVPDRNGFEATCTVAAIAEAAGENDLVICLLSGGGSALLADVPAGITEEELMHTNNLLVRCGAGIDEINTVRKHLSGIKGGRLAARVFPATLISLILSDVPGDSPEVIASGPTYPDSASYADALNVLSEHNILDEVPQSVSGWLRKGTLGQIPESPGPGDRVFSNTVNILIGNNRKALDAAAGLVRDSVFRSLIIHDDMEGDTSQTARMIVKEALGCQSDRMIQKPACLLYGGETTLRVEGTGTGGRNQHMALICAQLLSGKDKITVLAAGTDGTDGPTDAAGAVIDGKTISKAAEKKILPDKYIMNFDSYNFFCLAGGHIKTGPTLTNVMDIVVVVIDA